MPDGEFVLDAMDDGVRTLLAMNGMKNLLYG
jgi:hypothetical protein